MAIGAGASVVSPGGVYGSSRPVATQLRVSVDVAGQAGLFCNEQGLLLETKIRALSRHSSSKVPGLQCQLTLLRSGDCGSPLPPSWN